MLSPSSSDFANLIVPVEFDLRAFAGIEWIFVVASTATSLLFAAAAIVSSSAEHNGVVLHPKDLISCVAKAWKRPFVTLFYTTLLDLGYVFFALAFVAPLIVVFDRGLTLLRSLFFVLAFLFVACLYFYLAIVWTLAIVVSILEEKCGIEALAKAGEIVKGLKLRGFLLKLLFGELYYLLLQLLRSTIDNTRSLGARICIALVVVNSICFVKIFSLIAYTVFYYDCKKFHGEVNHGVQAGLEYTKTGTETNTAHHSR